MDKPPRNPPQAARACCGVANAWTSSSTGAPHPPCFLLCREMFSNGLRALSERRRSIRATRDSKCCQTHAAGRVRETAASDFRLHVLGVLARRLTGESPVRLIVERSHRPWFLTGGLTDLHYIPNAIKVFGARGHWGLRKFKRGPRNIRFFLPGGPYG